MIDYNEIIKKGRSLLADMYGYGYADAEKKHNSDLDYKDGLEDGRMEAWECAKKLILNKKDGGLSTDEIKDIFAADAEDYTVFKNLSASEAIAKIKEYEQVDKMSLKDALNWMKDYFRTIDMPMPQYDKAFEMAIKALEQEPKTGHCKDCKYFEYDSVAKVDGVPLIVAHEICSRWGDGCKTKEDGYCFLYEPQEGSDKE